MNYKIKLKTEMNPAKLRFALPSTSEIIQLNLHIKIEKGIK